AARAARCGRCGGERVIGPPVKASAFAHGPTMTYQSKRNCWFGASCPGTPYWAEKRWTCDAGAKTNQNRGGLNSIELPRTPAAMPAAAEVSRYDPPTRGT